MIFNLIKYLTFSEFTQGFVVGIHGISRLNSRNFECFMNLECVKFITIN